MRLISQRSERQICGHSAANSYFFIIWCRQGLCFVFSSFLVMATSTAKNFWGAFNPSKLYLVLFTLWTFYMEVQDFLKGVEGVWQTLSSAKPLFNWWKLFLKNYLKSPEIVLRAYSKGRNILLRKSAKLRENSESLWHLSHNSLPCPYPQFHIIELYSRSVWPRRWGLPLPSAPSLELPFHLSRGRLLTFPIPLPGPGCRSPVFVVAAERTSLPSLTLPSLIGQKLCSRHTGQDHWEPNCSISVLLGIKFHVTRDNNGHFIMETNSTCEKDTTITNIHACNNRGPKYIKQNLRQLKGKIDNSIIIGGDLNTFLSIMDRTTRKEFNLRKKKKKKTTTWAHYKPTRPKTHWWDTPCNGSRIYILLMHMWNFL